MKIKDIMTKNVAYISPTSSVVEAAQLMQKHNVGSVPVCDQNGVVGIVTDRDIVVRNIAHGKAPLNTQVKDVMTSGVKTVPADMDVNEASRLMSQQQVRRLPVVENKQLVGMVSLGDLAVDDRFYSEASEALADISFPARPVKM
jgi:CBS domain-containing protein